MQNDESLGVYGLAFFGLMIWLFWPGNGDHWTDRVWYSITYHVGLDQIHIDSKPADCDWTHAPLGDKGCWYNAMVKAYNSEGGVVAGDDAPKYSHDSKTGKPIISYDDGKTWAWLGGDIPDLKIKTVAVIWLKASK